MGLFPASLFLTRAWDFAERLMLSGPSVLPELCFRYRVYVSLINSHINWCVNVSLYVRNNRFSVVLIPYY